MFKHLFYLIAGSELGKSESSLNNIGSLLASQSFGQAKQNIFINPIIGNLFLEDHQKIIKVHGFQLVLGMIYNSIDGKWRFSQEKKLLLPSNNNSHTPIKILQADGSQINFVYDLDEKFYIAKGLAHGNQILVQNLDGSYKVQHFADGLEEIFDKHGLLTRKIDSIGRVLNYQYTESGQLNAIIAKDAEIHIDRKPNNLTLSYVSMDAKEHITLVSYQLDDQGRLQSSEIPVSQTEKYSIFYDYNGEQLSRITQTDTTRVDFKYETASASSATKLPRLVHFKFGDGRFYDLEYDSQISSMANAYGDKQIFSYDLQKRLTSYEKPTSKGEPLKQTYSYDANGHLFEIVDADGATYTQQFHPKLGLKTHEQNRCGQQIDYFYTSNGSLASITKHLVGENKKVKNSKKLTTFYVRDDKRQLIYLINPKGGVTKYTYDDEGNRFSTVKFINAGYEAAKKLSPQSVIKLATLQQWAKKQNPLQQTLTQYAYNSRNQCTSIIKFANRNVKNPQKGLDDAFAYHEETLWDIFNQVVQQKIRQGIDKNNTIQNSVTKKVFDNLQRCVQVVDAMNAVTKIKYDDELQSITIESPNGLIQSCFWNAAGQTYEKLEACKAKMTQRETQFIFDKAGRPLKTILPNKKCEYTLYDVQDRLALVIDVLGRVEQTHYDIRDNVQQVLRYQAPIEISSKTKDITLNSVVKKLILTPGKDRYTTWLHDQSNRLQFKITADGAIQQINWDSLDRKTLSVRYVTPIKTSLIPQFSQQSSEFMQSLIIKNNQDRQHYFYYEDDNQKYAELIGTAIAGGYLTIFENNFLWHKKTIQFATEMDLSKSLSGLKPIYSVEDAVTYYYRDLRGQVIGACDAESYLDEYIRLACGEVANKIRYYNQVNPEKYKTMAELRPKLHPEDFQWRYQYDLNLREIVLIELPLGKQTLKNYDAVGNIIYHAQGPLPSRDKPQPQLRAYHYQYNAWSQKTAELNPQASLQKALVDLDTNLSPKEKITEIKSIWQKAATRYIFDRLGLQTEKILPEGTRTLFYYDDAKRLVVMLNHYGAINQTTWNSFDDVIKTHRFAQPIPADKLNQLAGGICSTKLQAEIDTLADADKDIIEISEFDGCSRVTLNKDGEGFLTLNQYNSFGEKQCHQRPITKTLLAEDRFDYDVRGNVVHSQLDVQGENIETHAAFNFLNLPIAAIDAEGQKTTYINDKLGHKLKTILPNRLVSEQTWDAHSRQLTDVDTNGQTWRIVYNTQAAEIIHTSPVGRKKTSVINVFEQILEETDSYGYRQQISYEPGGLIASEIDQLGYSRKHTYSVSGWHLSTTDKNGLLTVNQHDDLGRVVAIEERTVDTKKPQQPKVLTRRETRYDSFDRAIASKNANGIWTEKNYDRRDLVIEVSVDPTSAAASSSAAIETDLHSSQAQQLNLLTQTAYDGQHNPVLITQGDATAANQKQTQKIYDGLNRQISEIIDPISATVPKGLHLEQKWQYNRNGLKIKHTDANGNITRYYYDSIGRLIYQLRPYDKVSWAQVTQYTYANYIEQVLDTTHYYYRLNADKLNDKITLSGLEKLVQAIADPVLDSKTFNRYDNDGKLFYSIDASGYVKHYLLDSSGLDFGHSEYANAIDVTKLTANTIAEVAKQIKPSPDDRNIWHSLDPKGEITFVLERCSPLNMAVTLMEHDVMGDVLLQCEFANPIAVAPIVETIQKTNRIPAEIVNALLKSSAGDRKQYYVNDLLNRLCFHIDAENYVNAYIYDQESNQTQSSRYAKPIKVPQTRSLKSLTAALQNVPVGRHEQTVYDAAERKITAVDGNGNSEHFKLDALSQCVAHTDKQGAIWLVQFDRAGRTVEKRTPKTDIAETSLAKGKITLTQSNRSSITSYQLDNNGNVLTLTIGVGTKNARTISMQYNSHNVCIATHVDNVPVDNPASTPTSELTLPVEIKTLTTKQVFNTRGKKIVEQNQAGKVWFYIYDKSDALAYQIDGDGYVSAFTNNAFHQATQIYFYAQKLVIDSTKYVANGITLAEMQSLLAKHKVADEDRTVTLVYDNRGLKTATLQSKVWMHTIGPGNSLAYVRQGQPTTEWMYNNFKEKIKQQTLIQATLPNSKEIPQWEINYFWCDKNGNCIAEVDANRYAKLYEFNFDGKELSRKEIANDILPEHKLENISFAALKKFLRYSPKDCDYSQSYDALGQLLSKTQHHVDLTNKQTPVDLVTTFVRNALGKVTQTTHPNQAKSSESYNALNQLVKKVAVPRDTIQAEHWQRLTLFTAENDVFSLYDVDKQPVHLYIKNAQLGLYDGKNQWLHSLEDNISIQLYYFDKAQNTGEEIYYPLNLRVVDKQLRFENAHQQLLELFTADQCSLNLTIEHIKRQQLQADIRLYEVEYFVYNCQGNLAMHVRAQTQNPAAPYQYQPSDQITIKHYDTRGKLLAQQTPEETERYFTHNATGDLARRYFFLQQWVSGGANAAKKQVLQQAQWTYDARHHQIAELRTITGGDARPLYKKINAFGEVIAEGIDNKTWPIEHKYDQAGRMFMSNRDNNLVIKLMLHDGRGKMTRTMTPNDVDFSKVNYADLPQIAALPFTSVRHLALLRDPRGDVMQQLQPQFKRLKPGTPEPIELMLTIGKMHPEFGVYSMSWPQIDDKGYITQVHLRVVGETKTQTLTAVTIKGRTGVNISALATDLYDCKIDYFFVDPYTHKPDVIPRFQAQATVGLDTGNCKNSKNAVLIQESENTIIVTGKAAPVYGLEVYEKGNPKPIARVPYRSILTPGIRLLIDLSHLATGDYQFKPIYGFTLVGNRTPLNGKSTAGFLLEYHCPQVSTYTQAKGRWGGKPYQTNAVVWKDFPRDCEKLEFSMAYSYNRVRDCSYIEKTGGNPNSGVYCYPGFPEPDKIRTNLCDTRSLQTFYFSPIRLAMNNIFARDSEERLWHIANAYNPEQPHTRPKSYLYAIPEPNPQPNEGLLVFHGNQPISCLSLTPWMNNSRRAQLYGDIAVHPQNYSYQAIRLDAAKPTTPLSPPMRIITPTSPSKLVASHLYAPDFNLYTVITNTHQVKSRRETDDIDWGWWGVNSFTLADTYKDTLYYMGWEGAKFDFDSQPITTGYYGSAFSNTSINFYKANNKYPTGEGHLHYTKFSDGSFHLVLTMWFIDKIILYSGYPGKPVHKTAQGATTTTTAYYPFSKLLLYPIPPNTHSWDIQYLDNALVYKSVWRPLNTKVEFFGHTMTIDVSSLPPSHYQYKIILKDIHGNKIDISHLIDVAADGYGYSNFTLNDSGLCVPTEPKKAHFETVLPIKEQATDFKRHIVYVKDERGNVTNYVNNALGLAKQIIHPEITVTNANGVDKQMRPEEFRDYDTNAKVIKDTNPDGDATTYLRNLLGETVLTKRADGVWQSLIRDGFGNVTIKRTPVGDWKQQFNHANKITASTDPMGRTTHAEYDAANNKICETSPSGNATRYVFDVDNNVVTNFDALGHYVVNKFDHNHRLLYQHNGDAAWHPLEWQRTYSGDPTQHIDRAGAVIQYKYQSFSASLMYEIGTQVAKHGWQYGPAGEQRQVPGKSIGYVVDEAGHLRATLDNALALTTEYLLDNDGEVIGERFIASDGHVYQDTLITRNARGWIERIYDARVGGSYKYTASGLRRAMLMYYFWEQQEHPYLRENWYSYNPAGLTVMAKGDLVNGKIQLTEAKGLQFDYDAGGRRLHQNEIVNGVLQTTTLTLDSSGLLSHMSCTDGGWADYKYNPDSHNTVMTIHKRHPEDKNKWHTIQTSKTLNQNNWVTNLHNAVDGKPMMDTVFSAFNPQGQHGHQENWFPSKQEWDKTNPQNVYAYHDMLDTDFAGFNNLSLEIQAISGTRERHNQPQKGHGIVQATFDSNANYQSFQGDLSNKASRRFFITNSENRIVYKTTNLFNRQGNQLEAYYFYWQGNPYGRLSDFPDETKRHRQSNQAEEIASFTTRVGLKYQALPPQQNDVIAAIALAMQPESPLAGTNQHAESAWFTSSQAVAELTTQLKAVVSQGQQVQFNQSSATFMSPEAQTDEVATLEEVQPAKVLSPQIETEILMQYLDRPILFVDTMGTVANPLDAMRFEGEPIFVCHHRQQDPQHFDALQVSNNQDPRVILNVMLDAQTEKNKAFAPPPEKDVDFDLLNHPYSLNMQAKGMTKYYVHAGQSYADISRAIEGGDPSFAAAIAAANNQSAKDMPPAGAWIKIPDFIGLPRHNMAGIYASYNKDEIIGSIYPNMPTPPVKQIHHHHSFWHTLIEDVIGEAILTFAPEVLASLLSFLGPLAVAVAEFAAGALADLAEQGVALALGDEHKLSWHEALKAGIRQEEFYVANELAGFNPKAITNITKDLPIIKAIETNSALQALRLVTQQSKRFSWRELLTSALSSEVQTRLGKEFGKFHHNWAMQFVEDSSQVAAKEILADAINHQALDAELIAANALGSAVGEMIGEKAKQVYQKMQRERHEIQAYQNWLKQQTQQSLIAREKAELTDPLLRAEYLNEKMQRQTTEFKQHKMLRHAYASSSDQNQVTKTPHAIKSQHYYARQATQSESISDAVHRQSVDNALNHHQAVVQTQPKENLFMRAVTDFDYAVNAPVSYFIEHDPTLADIVTDLDPITAFAKSLQEIQRGYDPITGQRVSTAGGIFNLGMSVLPLAMEARAASYGLRTIKYGLLDYSVSRITAYRFSWRGRDLNEVYKGLGDEITSPWLADKRVGVRVHLEEFRSGASFLVPKRAYIRHIRGKDLIGDPEGQFVIPKTTMDKLLTKAGRDLKFVRSKLGIPKGRWKGRIRRVDIHNPLLHNLRLPSGLERGSNSMFRWGGYTKNGLPEATISPVPKTKLNISKTKLIERDAKLLESIE